MSLRKQAAWLSLTLFAGAGAPSGAQEPALTPETPSPPRYRVEFILFAHADVDLNEESFAHENLRATASAPQPPVKRTVPFALPPYPRDDSAGGSELEPGANPGGFPDPRREVTPGRVADAAAPTGAADVSSDPLTDLPADALAADGLEFIDPFGQLGAPSARAPFWFRVLKSDELELGDLYARIERLRAYRAIAHGGWVQEGLDEALARPMDLATLGVRNPTGTLRLRLSRFLHLNVELDYVATTSPPATDAATFAFPGLEPLAELPLRGTHYRIVEERRARSGELWYVDHPVFGLLFRITPAPVEEPVDGTVPAA